MAVSDAELEKAFQNHDADGSGLLDAKELLVVLREAGMEFDEAIVKTVLKAHDTDASGTLDLAEFKAVVAEIRDFQSVDDEDEDSGAVPAAAAAAAETVASGASDDDDAMVRAFNKYDADGSGTIDSKELVSVLREIGMEMDLAIVTKVLEGYDDDNSGALDMDEFRKIVAELRQYQAEQGIQAPAAPAPAPAPADEIEMVFQKFDADRSGTIDPKELTKMLREMGIDADASAATTVISAFDSDKSGGLGVAEFRKLVTEIRAATSGKRDEKAPMPARLKAIRSRCPRMRTCRGSSRGRSSTRRKQAILRRTWTR